MTKTEFTTEVKRWDEWWRCICYVGIAVNNVGAGSDILDRHSDSGGGDTARSNAKPMPP